MLSITSKACFRARGLYQYQGLTAYAKLYQYNLRAELHNPAQAVQEQSRALHPYSMDVEDMAPVLTINNQRKRCMVCSCIPRYKYPCGHCPMWFCISCAQRDLHHCEGPTRPDIATTSKASAQHPSHHWGGMQTHRWELSQREAESARAARTEMLVRKHKEIAARSPPKMVPPPINQPPQPGVAATDSCELGAATVSPAALPKHHTTKPIRSPPRAEDLPVCRLAGSGSADKSSRRQDESKPNPVVTKSDYTARSDLKNQVERSEKVHRSVLRRRDRCRWCSARHAIH